MAFVTRARLKLILPAIVALVTGIYFFVLFNPQTIPAYLAYLVAFVMMPTVFVHWVLSHVFEMVPHKEKTAETKQNPTVVAAPEKTP